MVRFLLEAGADQEHKTDEMHTALMEACMVSISPKPQFELNTCLKSLVVLFYSFSHSLFFSSCWQDFLRS